MSREKPGVTVLVYSLVLAGVGFAADASAACKREALQKLTETYVKAQSDG